MGVKEDGLVRRVCDMSGERKWKDERGQTTCPQEREHFVGVPSVEVFPASIKMPQKQPPRRQVTQTPTALSQRPLPFSTNDH